ncbi:helix-turn-helix domain-containing protein [Geobacter sp. SVR]|uniref:winged helix-turn-helix transcriptional regulator n=1 Tax=Geobacter sp. SVR TaxID=2495594 RepID=UPI00143EFD04|nr:helix-turn-helix domain-containing protein [Geobacter sp. SVR]BCS55395.1 HxlR family transcriptional regulator [Geobacter sp. SVR]GCF87318.1 HxlR family transcriptional regulator [Geobacter sp. SVR]
MKENQAARSMLYREKEYTCGIDVTLAVVGGKWKASILWHLAPETIRFSDLQRRFSDTTRKMLTQQLRELEADGLVHREVYPQVPPKVEYSLTDKGRSIYPILEQMCSWGREYEKDGG